MKKIILAFLITLFIGIILWNNTKRLSKSDKEYIISKEWLSGSGNIIRFDDGSNKLSNDTIFSSDGKPYCKLINIKYDGNVITVYSFSKKRN